MQLPNNVSSFFIVCCPDEQGRIFIDRDGRWFRLVLNFLRDGGCELPESSVDRRELLREADYYQARLVLQAISCRAPFTWPSGAAASEGFVPAEIKLSRLKTSIAVREMTPPAPPRPGSGACSWKVSAHLWSARGGAGGRRRRRSCAAASRTTCMQTCGSRPP